MKRKLPLKRQIICEVCGIQYNRSALADRDICYKCYQSETKTHYPGCGHAKRGVVSEAEFCPRCLMRPKEKCVSCSRITVLHNKEARLCQLCDHRERQRIRQKDKLIKVECSVCGKVRAS